MTAIALSAPYILEPVSLNDRISDVAAQKKCISLGRVKQALLHGKPIYSFHKDSSTSVNWSVPTTRDFIAFQEGGFCLCEGDVHHSDVVHGIIKGSSDV